MARLSPSVLTPALLLVAAGGAAAAALPPSPPLGFKGIGVTNSGAEHSCLFAVTPDGSVAVGGLYIANLPSGAIAWSDSHDPQNPNLTVYPNSTVALDVSGGIRTGFYAVGQRPIGNCTPGPVPLGGLEGFLPENHQPLFIATGVSEALFGVPFNLVPAIVGYTLHGGGPACHGSPALGFHHHGGGCYPDDPANNIQPAPPIGEIPYYGAYEAAAAAHAVSSNGLVGAGVLSYGPLGSCFNPSEPWPRNPFDRLPGDDTPIEGGQPPAVLGSCGAMILLPGLAHAFVFPVVPNQPGTPCFLPSLDSDYSEGREWAVNVSPDGQAVLGGAWTEPTDISPTAVSWSYSGLNRPNRLDPAGQFGSSIAAAATGSGIVVGTYASGLNNPPTTRAFIWDNDNGMRDLQTYLLANNLVSAAELEGWILLSAADISHDGKTIVGHGLHEIAPGVFREEGYVIYPDCNDNDVHDVIDIATGFSPDCNGNDIPDSCDIAGGASQDCNGNGVPDECDIANGTSKDCNGNGRPDECDFADGGDCNGNGVLDDCECKIDLVFIIDTSGSMAAAIDGLCGALPAVLAQLENTPIDVEATVWSMVHARAVPITCDAGAGNVLTAPPPAGLGQAIPNTDPVIYAAGCPQGDGQAPQEDWGGGTALAADLYPWRPGSVRIIVPISDVPPRCGGQPNPVSHAEIIEVAIFNATEIDPNNPGDAPVLVYPIMVYGASEEAQGYAGQLAGGTGGRWLDLLSNNVGYIEQAISGFLLDAIRSACPNDCDLDGVPDSCEQPRPSCRCQGDWNLDGVVNSLDISAFLADWVAGRADFNGDGVTNSTDTSAFLAAWNTDVTQGCNL